MTIDESRKRKRTQKAFERHDSQVETLIEAWSHEPVLYDSCHEEYHIKDKRRLAIERLLTRIQTDFEPPFPSSEEIVRKLAPKNEQKFTKRGLCSPEPPRNYP